MTTSINNFYNNHEEKTLKNIFKRKQKTEQIEPASEDTLALAGEYAVIKEKPSKKKKIIIAIISVAMCLVLACGIYIFTLFNVKKTYETVPNLLAITEPIQYEYTNEIKTTIDDYEVIFKVKAAYSISGKVVEKYYYPPFRITNKLARFDIGMIWGPLLAEDLDEQMTFKNTGNRFLRYSYKNSLVQKLGSKEAVVNNISNNHVIHSNEHILKLIRNIKEGDFIRIEGFLVDVHYTNGTAKGHWPTSLSRTDHGDGACEVIYVTNIVWLTQE